MQDMFPETTAHGQQRVVLHIGILVVCACGDLGCLELAADLAGMSRDKLLDIRFPGRIFSKDHRADDLLDIVVLKVGLDWKPPHQFLKGRGIG